MKQRGFALMLVIWVLVLLGVLASSFTRRIHVETETASWLADEVRLQAAAQAGVSRAVLALSTNDPKLRWQTDGRWYTFNWQGTVLKLRLRNESAKIDLNYAPRSVIAGLLQQQFSNKPINELADALIDWRDRDNTPRDQGAEAREYLNAGLRYVPANGPLSSIAELSQVMGFQGDAVEQLRPYITVYSRRPKVDASSAPAEVIAAIPGINQNIAAQFVNEREQAKAAGQVPDYALLAQAQRYIEVRPSTAVVSIDVQIGEGDIAHREQAIVRLQSGGSNVEILAWHVIPNISGSDG